MVAYKLCQLKEYPQLYNALILCILGKLKWRDLYMDPSGELAISFYGKLNEKQIRTVLMHFKDILEGESHVELQDLQPLREYQYFDDYTTIYTPDGYDYENMVIKSEEPEEEWHSIFESAFATNESNDWEID